MILKILTEVFSLVVVAASVVEAVVVVHSIHPPTHQHIQLSIHQSVSQQVSQSDSKPVNQY